MKTLRILPVLFLALAAAACGKAGGAEPPHDRNVDQKDVVATVNGAPITDLDVRLRARSEGHKEAREVETRTPSLDGVLDTVIREEAAAQRAADPGRQDSCRLPLNG